jgi:molybdopterin converting factor small subunit
MAHVELTPSLCARFTDGVPSVEVDAATVLQLVQALERLFPGIGEHIEARVSVAIDGMVIRDWTTAIAPQARIFLIPRIAGG